MNNNNNLIEEKQFTEFEKKVFSEGVAMSTVFPLRIGSFVLSQLTSSCLRCTHVLNPSEIKVKLVEIEGGPSTLDMVSVCPQCEHKNAFTTRFYNDGRIATNISGQWRTVNIEKKSPPTAFGGIGRSVQLLCKIAFYKLVVKFPLFRRMVGYWLLFKSKSGRGEPK